MQIQGDNLALEILKWVGIVLAAGFIGYFGRYLARHIIERTRKGRPQPPPTAEPTFKEVAASPDTRLEEARLKIEKKRAKADAKRIKKAKKD
ncbi:hypothetical protein ES703_88086 [subsurface metagenome]